MESTLSIRKAFIMNSYTAEYKAKAAIKNHSLPYLVDFILCKIIPLEAFSEGKLSDMKGRDLPDLVDKAGGTEFEPKKEELFLIKGKSLNEEDDDRNEDEPVKEQDFSVRALSSLKEFVGSHHVVYSLSIEKDGALIDFSPEHFTSGPPSICIEHFSVSIELFESRFVGPFFGFSPGITKRFYLTASESEIQIELSVEALKQKNQIAFSTSPLLESLAKVLSELCGEDLVADYAKHCTK